MIIIKSRDGAPRKINFEAAKYSGTIKEILEVFGSDDTGEIIPLDGITEDILDKIVQWLNYCKFNSMPNKTSDLEIHFQQWKAEFFERNSDILTDILKAANYLRIQNLLDITSQLLANMILGKSPDSIRKMFKINDDLTLEQKEMIRRENDLCGVPRP